MEIIFVTNQCALDNLAINVNSLHIVLSVTLYSFVMRFVYLRGKNLTTKYDQGLHKVNTKQKHILLKH